MGSMDPMTYKSVKKETEDFIGREERALSNWQRHSAKWNNIEQILAKRSGKDPSQLLMSRLEEYRQQMKDQDALALKKENIPDTFFYGVGLRIGTDLLGITLPMPRIQSKPRDHIIKNGPRRRFLNGEYVVQKQKQMKESLSISENTFSHKDEHDFMKVLECDMHHPTMKSNFEDRPSAVRFREESIPSAAESDSLQSEPVMRAPQLSLVTKRLSFEARPGKVAPSVLTIHNQGTYAVFFKWEYIGGLSNLDVHASRDGQQRFYLSHRRGVIPPGAAFDFRVCFKSDIPGMFSERWKLVTEPEMEEWTNRVVLLQGVAIEEDIYKTKREEINRVLERRVAMSLALEAIEHLINQVWDMITANESARYKRGLPSAKEQAFRRENISLQLRYDERIVLNMDAIAAETLRMLSKPDDSWDRNVMTLHHLIESIPDADIRSNKLQELNQLVDELQSTMTSNSSFVLHTLGTDIISQIAEKIPAISATLRKNMGLPLERAAYAKFSIPDADDVDLQNAIPDLHKKATQPPVATPQTTNAAVKGGKPLPAATAVSVSAATKPIAPTPGKPGAPSTIIAKDLVSGPLNNPVAAGIKASRSDLTAASGTQEAPKSPRSWKKERAELEWRYRGELKTEVKALLNAALVRLDGLWGDVTEGRYNW